MKRKVQSDGPWAAVRWMKTMCLVLTCVLLAAACCLWLGPERETPIPVAIKIFGRAFDASYNYKVTFEVTNSSAGALTILCYSQGERNGPHLLAARSAWTFTLLDEDHSGHVNRPVRVLYTPVYGSFKEEAHRLLYNKLRIPLIKWKEVTTPDETMTNSIEHSVERAGARRSAEPVNQTSSAAASRR